MLYCRSRLRRRRRRRRNTTHTTPHTTRERAKAARRHFQLSRRQQRFALKHDHIWSQKLATQACWRYRALPVASMRCAVSERASRSSSSRAHNRRQRSSDAAMTTTATTSTSAAAALEIAVNWHSVVRSSLCSFLFRQSNGAVAFQLLHRLVASYQNQVWFQFST